MIAALWIAGGAVLIAYGLAGFALDMGRGRH